MLKFIHLPAGFLLVFFMASASLGQEYSIAAIQGAPPSGEVPEDLSKLMSDTGMSVKKGASRTVCEIWLCKELEVDPEFKLTEERLYPFTPGQLIGLLHFKRSGADFRDQTIDSGWYALRFGLQPIDGNHVGTSLTRDFLIMVKAENDAADKEWEEDALIEAGAESAGASHPAMLCLRKATDGKEPAMLHDEANDWWAMHVIGKSKGGDSNVPIDLIVVGHAVE